MNTATIDWKEYQLIEVKEEWKQEPKTYWRYKPKVWEVYFLPNLISWILSYTWVDDEDDKKMYANCILYKTEQEAEKARDINEAIIRVNDAIDELNEGWVPDWNDDKDTKCCIYYDFYSKCFDYNFYYLDNFGAILNYMQSKYIVEKIIKEHEKDLQLIFWINEETMQNMLSNETRHSI